MIRHTICRRQYGKLSFFRSVLQLRRAPILFKKRAFAQSAVSSNHSGTSLGSFKELLSRPDGADIFEINKLLEQSDEALQMYSSLRGDSKIEPNSGTFNVLFGKLTKFPLSAAVKRDYAIWKEIFSDMLSSSTVNPQSGDLLLKRIQQVLLRAKGGLEAAQLLKSLKSTSDGKGARLSLARVELLRFSEIFRAAQHSAGSAEVDRLLASLPATSAGDASSSSKSPRRPAIAKSLASTVASQRSAEKLGRKELDDVKGTILGMNKMLRADESSQRAADFDSKLELVRSTLSGGDDARALSWFAKKIKESKNEQEVTLLYEALKESGKKPMISTFFGIFRKLLDLQSTTVAEGTAVAGSLPTPSDPFTPVPWQPIWHDLRRSSLPLSGKAASVLLRLMGAGGRPEVGPAAAGDEAFSLLQLLASQKAVGVWPLPVPVVVEFMTIFKTNSQPLAAQWLLKEISTDPNCAAYTSNVAFRDLAVEMEKDMKANPDLSAFATAKQNLERLASSGELTPVRFNALLDQCTHFEYRHILYEQLATAGVKPNSQTFSSLFSALKRAGGSSLSAVRFSALWKEFSAIDGLSLDEPTAVCLARLLQANSYSLSHEFAEEVFRVTEKKLEGAEGDRRGVYDAFLKVFDLQSNQSASARVLARMRELSIDLSSDSYLAAMGANVGDIDNALSLFKEMESRNVKPSDCHFLALSRAATASSKKRRGFRTAGLRPLHPEAARRKKEVDGEMSDDFRSILDRASAVTRLIEGFALPGSRDNEHSDELAAVMRAVSGGRMSFTQGTLRKVFKKFLVRGDTASAFKLIDWSTPFPSDLDLPRDEAGREKAMREALPDVKLLAPTPAVVLDLIQGLTRNHEDTQAHKELLEHLQRIAYPISAAECTKLVEACVGNATVRSVTSKAADPVFAEMLFNLLLEKDTKPSLDLVHAMMRVYQQSSDVASCEEMFRRIPEFELEPSTVSYNILMKAFCMKGRADNAELLFREMMDSSIDPDRFTFSDLLKSFARGHSGANKKLIHFMQKHRVTPDTVASASVVSPFKNSRKPTDDDKLRQALGKVARMEDGDDRQSIRANFSFRELTDIGDATEEDAAKALKIFDQMISKGFPPSTDTCNSVLAVLCLTPSMMPEAWSFAEQHFFGQSSSLTPYLRTFELLIRGYGVAGDREGMRQTIEYMQTSYPDMKLTVPFFNTLMYAHIALPRIRAKEEYTKRGTVLAKGVFDQLVASGLQPDEVSYGTLMTAYMKSGMGQEASDVYDEMRKRGMETGQVPTFCMLHAWCRAGNLDKAHEAFEEHRNVLDDDIERAFAMLMHCHAEAKDSKGARSLLVRMDREGVPASSVCLDSALQAHVNASDPEGVAEIYERIVKEGLGYHKNIFSDLIILLGQSTSSADRVRAESIASQLRHSGVEPEEGAVEVLRGLRAKRAVARA
eukprot:930721_1